MFLKHLKTLYEVVMSFSGSEFLNKLQTLGQYIMAARQAGVLFTKEPYQIESDRKVTIDTKYIGDPNLHARGIPYETTKVITYTDNILTRLSEIIPIPNMLTLREKTYTAYLDIERYKIEWQNPITTAEYLSFSKSGPIYFLPAYSYKTITQDVYVTPNFDISLAAPGDIGPMFKYFPLMKTKNYRDLFLYTLCHAMFLLFSMEELIVFSGLTDPTFGATRLIDYMNKQAGADISSSYDYLMNLKQVSSVVSTLGQMFRKQLFPNTGYRELIMMIGNPGVIQQYVELTQFNNLYDRVRQLLEEHPPYNDHLVTDVTFTQYINNGPTTTKVERKYSMDSNGAYVHFGATSSTEFSQRLLKVLKLFKQTVEGRMYLPDDVLNDPLISVKTVSIPCNNWSDVRNLTKIYNIEQISKTYNFQTGNVTEVFDVVKRAFDNPGVIQSQGKWNAIAEQLDLTINGVNVTEESIRG